MDVSEFASIVAGFDSMGDRDRVRHLAWFLHSQRGMDIFATSDLRKCFEELRLIPPNISQHLMRMSEAKVPNIIRSRGGYKLHRRDMNELSSVYSSHPVTTVTTKLLSDLSSRVEDSEERVFLEETINCYKVKAYRAAIVMAWNLAYDHLARWVFGDPARVAALNVALAKKFQKSPPSVSTRQDLEGIKEFDVVEACGTAGLISSNVVKILKEKLVKRNIAAHPSSVVVMEPQANDVITDLINNVVLVLR